MTEVTYKVFTWDWKDEPDWSAINSYITSLRSGPYFHRVNTGSDSYAVLVADKKLLDVEVELLAEQD